MLSCFHSTAFFGSLKPYPPDPPGKLRVWAEKGIWDPVPGRSPMGWAVGPPEGVADVWSVCFSQGWGTLLNSVSERSPEIVIGTWSLQSIYGTPTRNGLAKAYT